jgi:hypothetical protein
MVINDEINDGFAAEIVSTGWQEGLIDLNIRALLWL